MKALRAIGASFLLIGGSIGVLISILTILDPVGTKMADDGDPFGVPSSFLESSMTLPMWLIVAASGVFLLFRLYRKRHTTTD